MSTSTSERREDVDMEESAPVSEPQTHAPPPLAQAPPPTQDPAPIPASAPAPGSISTAPLTATTFLLIDSQTAFTHPTHWGPARSNPSYESNISTLLSPSALSASRTQAPDPKSPLHPDAPGFAWMPYTTPIAGEHIVTKTVNSAFIGTELE
ncbi:hypothetical protein VE04_10041, partial [Pseudogymnoascus sp. 24MN13]